MNDRDRPATKDMVADDLHHLQQAVGARLDRLELNVVSAFRRTPESEVSRMDTLELIRQTNKLAEFESRITALENQLRDRQHRELVRRVERLEQLQGEGRGQQQPDEGEEGRHS